MYCSVLRVLSTHSVPLLPLEVGRIIPILHRERSSERLSNFFSDTVATSWSFWP